MKGQLLVRKSGVEGTPRQIALKRCLRISRVVHLFSAIKSWRVAVADGAATSQVQRARKYDIDRAQRRAGAVESELCELREEREKLLALVHERNRSLALAQRQLAQQVERRRAQETSNRQARERLGHLQTEAGRQRARADAVAAARAAECDWRNKAARAAAEASTLCDELCALERHAAATDGLVAAMRAAISEARRQQSRHAQDLRSTSAAWVSRLTAVQAAMAEDVRNVMRVINLTAAQQKAALKAARRAAEVQTPSATSPRASLRSVSRPIVRANAAPRRPRDVRGPRAVAATHSARKAVRSETFGSEAIVSADAPQRDETTTPMTAAAAAAATGAAATPFVSASALSPASASTAVAAAPGSETALRHALSRLKGAAQSVLRVLLLRRAQHALNVALRRWARFVRARCAEDARAEGESLRSLLASTQQKLAARKQADEKLRRSFAQQQQASRLMEVQVEQLQRRLRNEATRVRRLEAEQALLASASAASALSTCPDYRDGGGACGAAPALGCQHRRNEHGRSDRVEGGLSQDEGSAASELERCLCPGGATSPPACAICAQLVEHVACDAAASSAAGSPATSSGGGACGEDCYVCASPRPAWPESPSAPSRRACAAEKDSSHRTAPTAPRHGHRRTTDATSPEKTTGEAVDVDCLKRSSASRLAEARVKVAQLLSGSS